MPSADPDAFTHVILTRFSVLPTSASDAFSLEWLEYRAELFEAYCLPSLAAQTCPDFRWLVFCDVSTDPHCLRRLGGLASQCPQLHVVLVTEAAPGVDAAVSAAATEDSLLVTTRIDSDDATSTDFVARVQAYVPAFMRSGQPAAALAFSRGFKWSEEDAALFATWNPHSAHLTLFERLDAERRPVTVQSGNHGFMQERYPLHVDAGATAWLQILHGGNVSNHVSSLDIACETSMLAERFAFQPRPVGAGAVGAPQPEGDAPRAAFRQALEVALLGRGARAAHAPGSIRSDLW